MELICNTENCKLDAEFVCHCSSDLFFCKNHIENHCSITMHSMKSIYSTLDSKTQEQINESISKILIKIDETIEKSTKLAITLISQIKQNYKQAIISLKTQRDYYTNLIQKSKSKKIKKDEFTSI